MFLTEVGLILIVSLNTMVYHLLVFFGYLNQGSHLISKSLELFSIYFLVLPEIISQFYYCYLFIVYCWKIHPNPMFVKETKGDYAGLFHQFYVDLLLSSCSPQLVVKLYLSLSIAFCRSTRISAIKSLLSWCLHM